MRRSLFDRRSHPARERYSAAGLTCRERYSAAGLTRRERYSAAGLTRLHCVNRALDSRFWSRYEEPNSEKVLIFQWFLELSRMRQPSFGCRSDLARERYSAAGLTCRERYSAAGLTRLPCVNRALDSRF